MAMFSTKHMTVKQLEMDLKYILVHAYLAPSNEQLLSK